MQFIDLQAQYRALQTEIDARIKTVLGHGRFIMGPEIAELEAELAAFTDVKHVITCANGTDALQLLFMAYGVKALDAVFCPDITFIASVEPACMLGATPVFCDIDPDSFNISAESLEKQIEAVLTEGMLRPKAVVAVDFLGNPVDYGAIVAICKKYGLILIQDAAQSFGAARDDKRCGSFGDSAATSFFPAKPLGCYGDGGALFTNDDMIAGICRSLRVHGNGSSKYDNVRIGLNSRLDTLQAAILLPKLKALREYEMDARQRVAKRYDETLGGKFCVQKVAKNAISTYAQYAFITRDAQEREAIIARLDVKNIPSMIYYPTPMHALPVFQGISAYGETFENASYYCEHTLSLPMHPYLELDVQDKIIKAVLG